MLWNIGFVLAVLCLAGGIFWVIRAYKTKKNRSHSLFVLAASVFVSAAIMFFVLEYSTQYSAEPNGVVNAIFIAIHDTIGIFVVNTEFAFLTENMQSMLPWLIPLCSTLMAVYFISAPIFTFGFILSLFKNLRSRLLFALKKRADIYVFSELNEKSLVLASDIQKNHPRSAIVFCDVFENDDEKLGELLEDAKKLRAIFFEKDILDINFKKHIKKGQTYFFVIGVDDTENIHQAQGLIAEYGEKENTNLYLFSDSVSGEILLFDGKQHKMKVRRINESLALIQNTLYKSSASLFENACECSETGDKIISAVIVGLGGYGTEMFKTLLWYGQMDGYRLQIHAFDQDEDAEQRLMYQCPEVFSPDYNGKYQAGEAYYQVAVHAGIRTGTDAFAKKIAEIGNASYVLVSLGDDNLNIETAVGLRTLFERMKIKPAIYAIVHNSALAPCIENLTNYKDQKYHIRPIGSLQEMYSEAVVLHSAIEKDALAIHCQGYGGTEEDFYAFEYNYRSSTASALHNRARAQLKIHGADLPAEQRTPEQAQALMDLEHRRWNAYMRSIGYVYSGSDHPMSRNDLGKMHHNLVRFKDLTDDDRKKDQNVGSVALK